MRLSTFCEANLDGEPVASDQTARGGEQDGKRRIAGCRGGEQHAQGIALVEVGQPGDAAASPETDFDGTFRQ
jgi:hypothetical protein